MIVISFNDFVHKYKVKKATSNIKAQQVLSFLGVVNVGIYLRYRPFSSDIGLAYLQPSKTNHWVAYINEN